MPNSPWLFWVHVGDYSTQLYGEYTVIKELPGGFKHFLFSPLFGQIIKFDIYFFQLG